MVPMDMNTTDTANVVEERVMNLSSSDLIETPVGTYQMAPQLDIAIPVVDMQDFYDPARREQFLKTLYDAMTTIGFFAVRNTGVDAAVVKQGYAEAEKFFRQDIDVKMAAFSKEVSGQRGFVAGETAKGYRAKDYKEFYHIGRELSDERHAELGIAKNIWPEQPEFKEAMTTLFDELNRYVVPLNEAVIGVINLYAKEPIPANFFQETTQNGNTLLRALYYPALTAEQINNLEQPLLWAAEHTDIDLLAILPFATEKGLQVEVNGQWMTVIVPEDAFVVNVGDMLKNLTNGLFVSAKHRVLAQEPGKDRFSMVLFVHPTDDTSLAPLATCIEQTGGTQKFAPGTRKEFLWERLLELGIAPGLLEPYSKMGHVERQIEFGRASPQVVDLLIKNNLASPELLGNFKQED